MPLGNSHKSELIYNPKVILLDEVSKFPHIPFNYIVLEEDVKGEENASTDAYSEGD